MLRNSLIFTNGTVRVHSLPRRRKTSAPTQYGTESSYHKKASPKGTNPIKVEKTMLARIIEVRTTDGIVECKFGSLIVEDA
jgi:hypothetical protein